MPNIEHAQHAQQQQAERQQAGAAMSELCERALQLFDEVDAATSALDGGGGGGAAAAAAAAQELVQGANEKGQALVAALAALGLNELRDGGPVSLPRPESMADGVAVHVAQINWETDEGGGGAAGRDNVRWTDDATLAWVRFGLLHGHATPGLMPAALCLLARVERAPEVLFEGGKTSDEALGLLKAAARFRLDEIASGAVDPNAGDAANASVVWSAVCEAHSMDDMSGMFDLYRDPTSDDPAGDDEDDEDYDPEEEGPLFMEPYAACDACGTDLFLPSDQACPGMGDACGGLQPFVITPEQTTEEESFCCDMCSKICPEGEQMRGCRDCEFDLCGTCSGPWYHERDGGRDFCGQHWAVAEDKALFVLVTAPEDLGSQMDEYFGDDAGEGGVGEGGGEEEGKGPAGGSGTP